MEQRVSSFPFVFVHGLCGWGQQSVLDRLVPCWGLLGGSLLKPLRADGFRCVSATTGPYASAWDRACELYAALSGTRTDYGAAHARKMGHRRFGRDWSRRPLVSRWDADHKVSFVCHSFGGTAVRLLVHLLAFGSEEERASGAESPLFLGGNDGLVHSVTTIATPHNGTTVYDTPYTDPRGKTPDQRLLSFIARPKRDGRAFCDWADFDMSVDNAAALNARLRMPPGIWWFSVPCASTLPLPDGTHVPDAGITEHCFRWSALRMGSLESVTQKGIVLSDAWHENDGLVNTLSASFPEGAPHVPYGGSCAVPDVWNVFPVFRGDHLSLQGGITVRCDALSWYRKHLSDVCSLEIF